MTAAVYAYATAPEIGVVAAMWVIVAGYCTQRALRHKGAGR